MTRIQNRSLLVAVCAVAVSFSAVAQTARTSDALRSKYARPPVTPYPETNRFSKEKELLGRTLFFDPRLSGSGWISCASCHNPGLSWSDGLPKAIGSGMKALGRKTPTLINAGWADLLFWDGRADSLEEQALGPIAAPGEMNQDLDHMVEVLSCNPGYRRLFTAAFPDGEIGKETVAQAIATFERGIVSGTAPFDEWIGGRENAISEEARAGFELFNGKAGCAKCHSGWNFSDNGFHDVGLASDDPGRGKFIPVESQKHAFKTPGLRNIDRRAPYMHDGSEPTLAKTIDLYDRGGDVQRPGLAPEIKPLHLTADEKHALLEFLKTLTSRNPDVVVPELPR